MEFMKSENGSILKREVMLRYEIKKRKREIEKERFAEQEKRKNKKVKN